MKVSGWCRSHAGRIIASLYYKVTTGQDVSLHPGARLHVGYIGTSVVLMYALI